MRQLSFRGQVILIATVLCLTVCGGCASPWLAPRLQGGIAGGLTLLAGSVVIAVILVSLREVNLKRERRIWALLACVVGLVSLAQLLDAFSLFVPQYALLGHLADLLLLWGAALIWVALSSRSGAFPQQQWGKPLVLCNVCLLLISSVVVIADGLRPGLYAWQAFMFFRFEVAGYLSIGVVTLSLATVMLARSVPRQLHLTRAVLVMGLLLIVFSQLLQRYVQVTSVNLGPVPWAAVHALGLLCVAASAVWEVALLKEKARDLREQDHFPALLSLVIPNTMALIAFAVALHRLIYRDHQVSDLTFLWINLPDIAALIVLLMLWQLTAFAHIRTLYRQLQTRFAELTHHAATDSMTNLANHGFFMERLQREMRRATRYQRPLSLIFSDIDHFKHINDTHGHLTGDRALRAMAEILAAEVREHDLVARYGGEEFVVLLPETTMAQAAIIAERLRIAVERLNMPLRNGGQLHFTISSGLSAYPFTCDSLESLLATADHAMYQAKRKGRNRVILAPHCKQIAI